MLDRINLILKTKNLTLKQFSEEIGMQPSNMSHIMSGRHKPSLDFVLKVINRYPEINIKWLTLGEGEMFATSGPARVQREPQSAVHNAVVQNVTTPVAPKNSTPLLSPKNENSFAPTLFDVNDVADSTVDSAVTPVDIPDDEPDTYDDFPPDDTVDRVPSPARTAPKSLDNNVREKKPQKKIVKVVILYDDHSFAEYFPE